VDVLRDHFDFDDQKSSAVTDEALGSYLESRMHSDDTLDSKNDSEGGNGGGDAGLGDEDRSDAFLDAIESEFRESAQRKSPTAHGAPPASSGFSELAPPGFSGSLRLGRIGSGQSDLTDASTDGDAGVEAAAPDGAGAVGRGRSDVPEGTVPLEPPARPPARPPSSSLPETGSTTPHRRIVFRTSSEKVAPTNIDGSPAPPTSRARPTPRGGFGTLDDFFRAHTSISTPQHR
jgi:hypothetical protein